MTRVFFIILFAGLIYSSTINSSRSQPTEADYARVNLALAKSHSIPRYTLFSQSANALNQKTRVFCQNTSAGGLENVQAAFKKSLSAWMGIEHIRIGPVEFLMRNFRLHFWPDKGSRGQKQIRNVLRKKDTKVFSPDAFRSTSAAVQGFPAAERLLFGSLFKSAVNKSASSRGCRFLNAISGNIKVMSAAIVAEWPTFSQQIATAGSADNIYESHKEITTELLRSTCTSIQSILALKLERPLGKSLETARPKRAESWRSRISLSNIIANLSGLQAIYEGEAQEPGLKSLISSKNEKLSSDLSKQFAQTIKSAGEITLPLFEAVSHASSRAKVIRLTNETRELRKTCTGKLAAAIGIQLAFNSLDGD